MTNDGVHVFDESVQHAHLWIKGVADRLAVDDPQLALMALRPALHALRDRIGPEPAVHLGAQLPTLIRGVYYDGWRMSQTPTKERHRDEFLEHVANELPPTFPIDAEAATKAVFDLLWEKVDPNEVTKLIRLFPKELRELWHPLAREDAEEEEQATRQ